MTGLQTQNNPLESSIRTRLKSDVCLIICLYNGTNLLAIADNLAGKNNLGIFDGLEANALPPRKHLAALYGDGLSDWLCTE